MTQKIAIMQPYLFPYLGYFQLINSVDRLVFLDDVNYINKGWINRNRLIFSGKVSYFTVPLSRASQNVRICDISLATDHIWSRKLETSIRQSYSTAPNFAEVFDLISPVLFGTETTICEMAKQSIKSVARYLDLRIQFVETSNIYGNEALKREDRIYDICYKEKAFDYINLPSGRELYDVIKFAHAGIRLSFIQQYFPPYPQFSNCFHPGLSIIDVLMHNDPEVVKKML